MKYPLLLACGSDAVKALPGLVLALLTLLPLIVCSQEIDDSSSLVQNIGPHPLLKNAIETLAHHQVLPTADAMRKCLQVLDPGHPLHQQLEDQARDFVRDLQSTDYLVRENATRSLKMMTTIPKAPLAAAVQAQNPEVAYRARVILDYVNSRNRRDTELGVIDAVCVVVQAKQIKGMTDVLLETLKLVDDSVTQTAIGRALAATAVKSDVPRLKSSLQSENASWRIASSVALLELLGLAATEELLQRLKVENDDHVRVAFARSLANKGIRDALPILVGLLESEILDVRVESARVLRAITGQRFAFVAYDSPEHRNPSVKKWKSWLEENGETVKIHFPIVDSHLMFGRILYADYRLNKVVEVDMTGQEIWSRDFQGAWNVQGLPNGNRLVSSYTGHTVVEFNREGDEIWKLDRVPHQMMGLHRLETGNTLVGCGTKVIEYQPDSSVDWEAEVGGRVADCQRLSNGNTLVALFDKNSVIEINRQGETEWSIETANQPISVHRTDAGTTLVASLGDTTVNEYNHDKHVVWSFKANEGNSAVRRLPNGDTLITSKTILQLVSPERKVRWSIKGLQHSFGLSAY